MEDPGTNDIISVLRLLYTAYLTLTLVIGYILPFGGEFLKKGILHPAELFGSSGTETLHEICAGKQNVKPVHVFGYSSISHFGITKLSLYN